jgi:hypothetical protein
MDVLLERFVRSFETCEETKLISSIEPGLRLVGNFSTWRCRGKPVD